MESVLRAAVIYGFLLVMFRVIGRRTLGQMTNFDFVLLLIVGEATQQAMLSDDFSVTNCLVVILTLLLGDYLISIVKSHSPRMERWLDGLPVILVRDGELVRESMRAERIDETDVMEAARSLHGLERMDQVKHAILEKSGEISIVPREQ